MGFDNMLKYLDDLKPSHIDDATNDAKLASQNEITATAKFSEAKKDLGIDQ